MPNVTNLCDPLQPIDQSFVWPTYPYIAALSVISVLLLIYYYVWLPMNWVKDLSEVGYHNIKGASKYHSGKSKKDQVEEVRRRKLLGDMPPVYPNGWFAILESAYIKVGQVKHVQALGENFAVMRNSKGEVHVLDAYCPHLGANMAVGGVVRGDCLECPFHGWQFRGEDGTCAHIPYSDKVPKAAVVKKWASKEVNNIVFVWYLAEGEPPSWQVESIPEIETGKMWYCGSFERMVNAHIQDVVENLADESHFNAIHGKCVFAGCDISSYSSLIHSFMKHVWIPKWKQNAEPGESHMSTLYVNHSIRLFNKFTILPQDAYTTEVGPGMVVFKDDGSCLSIFTITPVEPMMIRIIFRTYSLPRLLVFGRIILYIQSMVLERDIMVWNHKRYTKKTQFVKEDEALSRHRRWYSQFYSANSPQYPLPSQSLEW